MFFSESLSERLCCMCCEGCCVFGFVECLLDDFQGCFGEVGRCGEEKHDGGEVAYRERDFL